MRVVFITIPGKAKQRFANALFRELDGNLSLVIVQKRKKRSIVGRLLAFIREHNWRVINELWYALLLRLNHRAKNALTYFRATTFDEGDSESRLAPTLEVDSVNSDEVYEILKKISPDLIAVWGSTILEPRILKTAKHAINLHFGLCPYYRGALANQHAALCDDIEHIGATVHYINGKADAGDILTTITADPSKSPQELFKDVNDRALKIFLETIIILNGGKEISATPQDISQSKNFLLSSWIPSIRYKVGKKVARWERA
jgi:folate-dependent phosphoribosylglycinamide formyltransferase PurN